MDFQVVVLAGGTSKKLVPLVSKEVPKALLPVANRPVLSYVLELLEQSNLKDLIVVVEGQEAAVLVGGWISSAYLDRLHVEVVAVSEDVGTADALRAISHHLTASDILVVSGDLVCDVPPGAVAAVHRRHDAVVTMLCSAPVSGPAESGSSGGKDRVKKPARCDIIGLDSTKQFLLHIASGIDVEKDVRVQKSILRAVGQMEILTDLMDAHLYAFKRSVLQEVLDQKERFQSLKHDVLPYLVRTQLASLKKIALDSQFPETCSINNIICQMVEEEDRTLVEIVEEDTPIDIIKYIDYVRAPQCGAITTFSGTTRDTFDSKKVMELRYEAYVPMAIRCLKSICASARSTWSLNSMAVAHKLGPVPVGETSVFIAISSVHRADALDACKFLIDELKATVPIWKKEVYENGEVWKENTEFLGRRTDLGKAITEEKEEDAHHKKGCCGVKIRVDDGL